MSSLATRHKYEDMPKAASQSFEPFHSGFRGADSQSCTSPHQVVFLLESSAWRMFLCVFSEFQPESVLGQKLV